MCTLSKSSHSLTHLFALRIHRLVKMKTSTMKSQQDKTSTPKKSLMSRLGKTGTLLKKKSSIEDHNDSLAVMNPDGAASGSYKPREEHPSVKEARESMLDDMMEPEE